MEATLCTSMTTMDSQSHTKTPVTEQQKYKLSSLPVTFLVLLLAWQWEAGFQVLSLNVKPSQVLSYGILSWKEINYIFVGNTFQTVYTADISQLYSIHALSCEDDLVLQQTPPLECFQ